MFITNKFIYRNIYLIKLLVTIWDCNSSILDSNEVIVESFILEN